MKVGIVFFHANIFEIHDPRWSDKCIESIRNQTYRELYFYEINFGGDSLKLVKESKFFNKKMKNFVEAMNFIITEAFNDGCDFVFNTNLDDFYHPTRIEKQLNYLKNGYDIVASEMCYVNSEDNPFLLLNLKKYGDIKYNLELDHNIIAHPVVGYSKRFWEDPLNRYDINNIPREDLDLWKQSINNGYKFYIHEDILLYYRIHDKQITKNN